MSTIQSWRVTVLVALYRAGRFLEAKLRTLEQQTAFDQCQIVLLNCQDLDGESAIYQSFADQHPNVMVLKYDDYRRLYPTWNDGIIATKSEYIMNSNADEMLHPSCIALLIDALDNNPGYDVAHCDSYVTDIPNQHWPIWRWHGLIETMYPGGTAGPCPLWRRGLHDKFGLFGDYRTIGDARIWERWVAGGVKFLRVPTPLVLYYHAPEHNLEVRRDEKTGRPLRALDFEQDGLPTDS